MRRGPSVMKTDNIRHYDIFHPPLRPGHAAWVSLWQPEPDKLMVSFQHMEGDRRQKPSYNFMKKQFINDYELKQLFFLSGDGGQHWRQVAEKKMFLPNLHFCITKTPVKSGKVLAVYSSHNLPGYAGGATVLFSSVSGGQGQWKKEQIIRPVPRITPNQIKAIGGNTLIITAYSGDGNCYYLQSKDEGANWSRPVMIAGATETMSFWEPIVEEIKPGCLLCVMRTHREQRGEKLQHNGINYHQVIMREKGGKYIPEKPVDIGFGFRGRPEIFKTSAGVLILAAPGGFFAFSRNGGENWETHPEIMRGLPHNADPNLLELADGRIICAYFFGSDWPFPPPVDEYIGCTVFNVRTS